MTTTLHPHTGHLAEIAEHLNDTAEATAPNQRAGVTYTSESGGYVRRNFHSNHGGAITFGYYIIAYDHTSDITVEVQHNGIETRIMVPGYTPADVIAHAVMSALRTTIDTLTTAQQGAEA